MRYLLGMILMVAVTASTVVAGAIVEPPAMVIQSPRDSAAVQRLNQGSAGKTPTIKNLSSDWIKSLAARGEPRIYTKANSKDFAYIGMPIGGIGAGELYLSGDGKLWLWDIFNTRCWDGFGMEQGHSYIQPHQPGRPDQFSYVLSQGFVLRTTCDGKTTTRTIDKNGFADVQFRGQYPIGYVTYRDPNCPVEVRLEAFSPFIPGDVDDSSYPATILNYTLTNTSRKKVVCSIGGWVENGCSWRTRRDTSVRLENQIVRTKSYVAVNCSAQQVMTGVKPPQVFSDFESGTYRQWTITGTAFGHRPVKVGSVARSIQTPPDCQGKYYVDTYRHNSNGPMGTLTSKPFVITRPYIRFLVGGGQLSGHQAVDLLVDGRIVRQAAGRCTRHLRPYYWDVQDLLGKTAQIQIVDHGSGGWAFIQADDFVFADTAHDLATARDSGTMMLALLGDTSHTQGLANANPTLGAGVRPLHTAATILTVPASATAYAAPSDTRPTVHGEAAYRATASLRTSLYQDHNPRLIGGLRHSVTLRPGQKVTLHYVLAWCFPNPTGMPTEPSSRRGYAARFRTARAVVAHLAGHFHFLTATTRLWHRTWYHSTLPWWFLTRTFLNVSTLASSTAFLVGKDNQFYGNEGGYSCPGTCLHVYSYQQVLDLVFPALEKSLQQDVELNTSPGGSMQSDGSISINCRGDGSDGQAGVILRAYLVSRMSADDSYLMRNYAHIKKAMNYLINHNDANHDGILEGAQPNTLDSSWYGQSAWLSLYYQAALRATAAMADEMHDRSYARKLLRIAARGRAYIEHQLFNGEYFVQNMNDPKHPNSPGSYNGCEIDQLMGQAWAYFDGLGPIISRAEAAKALDAIWKYNYTTNVGLYRKVFPKGRWFAMPGEGGVVMCTFPHGVVYNALHQGYGVYFDECWAGSEHLLAAMMMWQGMVDKALAVEKTIDERYSAQKRNPWDEVECGSHYARSMASYGVFVAACGFDYDGPRATLSFAPRMDRKNFRAAFITAQGWGSFAQRYVGKRFRAEIDQCYGTLRLKVLGLVPPAPGSTEHVRAVIDGKNIAVVVTVAHGVWVVHFDQALVLHAGDKLTITSQ
ncbi:MAG: hypothetical protein HKL95_01655 [Phycisphaerae bacterium]|nr:hypothetical protein [Phycisphaerae bacterium]